LTRGFLELLYGDVLDGSYFHLFTIPRFQARFFQDIDDAATYVDKLKEQPLNVYYSVGLIQRPPKEGRGEAKDVTGLIGVYADIDLQGPAKKSSDLPKSVDEALEWLRKWFPEPTVIVFTGHGIHPLWLFNEPWIFEDAKDKNEAQTLLRGWIATVQLRAKDRGWKADPVKDISRILRMPDTWNIKENKRTGEKLPPVRTKILEQSGQKYEPSDLWKYVLEDAERKMKASVEVTGDIRVELNPDAKIPDAFAKLAQRKGFNELWNLEDENKRGEDGQMDLNRYDLAITNHAVAAGLSNQEIADLLICFRRKHAPRDDKAFSRPDYIERTIKKARRDFQKEKAVQNLARTEIEAEVIDETIDENERQEARQNVLDAISNMIGIRITRIVRHPAEEPIFRVVTPQHNIMMGDASFLLDFEKFQKKIFAHAGHYIKGFNKKTWGKVAALFPKVWEDESIGEEATEQGGITAWIAEYLINNEPEADLEMIDDAIHRYAPVEKDNEVFIFGTDFRRWLFTNHGEKISAQKLGAMFRSVGMEPKVVSFQTARMKKPSTRSAWRVPGDLLP
jgi:hypothetical protein